MEGKKPHIDRYYNYDGVIFSALDYLSDDRIRKLFAHVHHQEADKLIQEVEEDLQGKTDTYITVVIHYTDRITINKVDLAENEYPKNLMEVPLAPSEAKE